MEYLKCLAFTAACVLIACPTQNAAALDLSLTARAEAGLDPATREFIKNLPGDWGPQIAQILNKSLDRVDISVKTYLNLEAPKFGSPSAFTLKHIDHVKKAHLIGAAQHDFEQRMRSLQDSYTKAASELHETLLARVDEIQNGEAE